MRTSPTAPYIRYLTRYAVPSPCPRAGCAPRRPSRPSPPRRPGGRTSPSGAGGARAAAAGTWHQTVSTAAGRLRSVARERRRRCADARALRPRGERLEVLARAASKSSGTGRRTRTRATAARPRPARAAARAAATACSRSPQSRTARRRRARRRCARRLLADEVRGAAALGDRRASGAKSSPLPRPPRITCTPPGNERMPTTRRGDVRGLRVVDVEHAVDAADLLQPVLDAGERRERRAHRGGVDAARQRDAPRPPSRSRGCARRAAGSRRARPARRATTARRRGSPAGVAAARRSSTRRAQPRHLAPRGRGSTAMSSAP